jgi:hypothetical protein
MPSMEDGADQTSAEYEAGMRHPDLPKQQHARPATSWHAVERCRICLDRQTLSCETEIVSRALDFVREFKGARGFKDGWYYRLTEGYPWIGPFVTEHIAGHARAHVTSNTRDVWSEPPWLKISTSVALGRLFLTPPRRAPAFRMPATSRHTVPASLPLQSKPLQSNGYQARPQRALSTRQETPAGRDENAAPESVMVPRRRGSRTA